MLAKLKLLAAATAVVGALLEATFRMVFPVPAVVNFNRMTYTSVWMDGADEHAGTPLAHASFVYPSDPDGFHLVHRLNLYGFRDRDWELDKTAATRVMMVGDSFVEGFGAEDGESLPAVFGRRARELGEDVEAMSFGVGGAGVHDYFEIVRDATPLFAPDDVVVVFFANDFPLQHDDMTRLRPSLVPERADPWQPRVATVLAKLLAGAPLPRAWIADPIPFFHPVPHPSNPWSNAPLAAAWREFVSAPIADAMCSGGFNPLIINEYARFRRRLVKAFELDSRLAALQQVVHDGGASLVVAYIPYKAQVSDAYLPYLAEFSRGGADESLTGPEYQQQSRSLAAACDRAGVAFVDTTPFLAEQERAGTRLYWRYDQHMNAEGYRRTGRFLCDRWRALRNGD